MIEPATTTSITGASRRERTIRLGLFAGTALILGFGLIVSALTWSTVSAAGRVGADFRLYLEASLRLLDGGSLYPAHQLAGPYVITDGDILYPPPIVLLMLPFAVLPAVLFWIVPLATIAAVVLRQRPAVQSWPILAVGLAYPVTSLKIIHGNPTMWIVAAIALATLTVGPAVFVLLKPTLAPFALIGLNHRRWWIALGVAVLIAAVFAPLWPDYIRALANARSPNGVLYSLDEVPFALLPIVAWAGSARVSLRGRHVRPLRRPGPGG